mgnify:CR=1 FL=1
MTLYKGTQLIAGLGKKGKDGISLICGQTIFSLDPLTNAGLHLLDGTVLPVGGSYDDFITNYIIPLYTAHPERFKTEAQWQDIVDEYGVCGYYVYTEGVSVRLPKVTGIVEGTVDVNALGSIVPESLPNIIGNTCLSIVDAYATGAFRVGSSSDNGSGANKTYTGYGVNFDASRSSSVYQDNAHVQPQTIKGYYYIVVSTVTKTDIEVDIDQIQTDLNNKVDANSLAECNVVIETYVNGTDGYRIWSDGYCEQWGVLTTSSETGTYSFAKTFKDTNYNLRISNLTGIRLITGITKNTNSFGWVQYNVSSGGTIGNNEKYFVFASGYLANGEY